MQPKEIREFLKAWGHAVANRYAHSVGDRSPHVLQQVRDLAPGSSENAMRQLRGRDGRDRRRFMAERSGVKGLRIIPMYAVDPVRASNDADLPHDNPEIPVDVGIPDHLLWVDRLVELMNLQKPVMAACVREEYCEVGSQAVKARRVNDICGLGYDEDENPNFKPWMYRSELDKAIAWMEGFSAAA